MKAFIFVLFIGVFPATDGYGVQFSDDYKILIRGNPDLTSYTVPRDTEEIQDGTEELNCFGSCVNLIEVKFEPGSKLSKIGSYAFYKCPLKSLNLRNCEVLDFIGVRGFAYCPITELLLPDSITTLSSKSFDTIKIPTVEIPMYLKSIPFWCFANNMQMKSFVCKPNSSLSTIEAEAFYFSGLESIRIPSSVTSLGAAFIGCKIMSVEVDPDNEVYEVFNGAIITKDGLNLILAKYNITSYKCPSTIKTIEYHCFRSTLLEEIELNNGLNTIKGYCFTYSKIKRLKIPSSVSKIYSYSFATCTDLESLEFEGSLTALPEHMLSGSTKIRSIILPIGLNSIGSYCFRNCLSLEYIWVPKTVSSIGGGAFLGVTADCVIDFENGSVMNLVGDLLYSSDFTNLCAYLERTPSDCVLINKSTKNILSSVFESSSVARIEFENGSVLEKIENAAFKNTKIGSIAFPSSIRELGEEVFMSCSNLENITGAEHVQKIGLRCFSGCSLLSSFIFGENLSSVDSSSFANCRSLKKVTFDQGCEPDSFGSNVFTKCLINTLTLPKFIGSVGIDCFAGSQLETLSLIQGSRIDQIWPYSFRKCTHLTRIGLLNGNIKTISEGAFEGCQSLESFVLPLSVETIDAYAFKDCVKLSTFMIMPGSSLSKIVNLAFVGCKSLNRLDVEDGDRYTFIEGSLIDCGSEKTQCTVVLHLQSNQQSVFSCNSPSSFWTENKSGREIPGTISAIGAYSFQECLNLKEIYLGEGVLSIGLNAFDGCENLEKILLPSSLQNIFGEIFVGCSSLQCGSVFYPRSSDEEAEEWKAKLRSAGIISEALSPCGTHFFTSSDSSTMICSVLIEDLLESEEGSLI